MLHVQATELICYPFQGTSSVDTISLQTPAARPGCTLFVPVCRGALCRKHDAQKNGSCMQWGCARECALGRADMGLAVVIDLFDYLRHILPLTLGPLYLRFV